MPFTIIRADIVRLETDAIVNAANTELQQGGGVCGAIFHAAGAAKLKAACDALAPIATGDAVLTPGFGLPAKFIIHAAGPVYRDGRHGEEKLLRACYLHSLDLALDNGCESIAFPLISSGIYGYPAPEALAVATRAIRDWLETHEMDVTLAVFDKTAFLVSKSLQKEIKEYIDQHYVESHADYRRERNLLKAEKHAFEESHVCACESINLPLPPQPFELDAPFSSILGEVIKAKNMSDVEVYKRANLDRKLFSKLRSPRHRPAKKTVLALAIALRLSLDETNRLLRSAGFALSRSVLFDVIVEYFITRHQYDIFEINSVLFQYDQPLLGG